MHALSIASCQPQYQMYSVSQILQSGSLMGQLEAFELREALALRAENRRQRHNTFGGISTNQNGETRQSKLQNKALLVTAAFKSSTLGTLGVSNHPKVPSN